jgi:haloacetate dehalogenase
MVRTEEGKMFENFQLEVVDLPEASLRVRQGGSGSPVLLLHGHPRTHATWHRVAPILAKHHTVICPDLRGFGQSSMPSNDPEHALSSKRAKARDCVNLLHHMGFDRFSIVGHDRGSYTAFRAAMDHPEAISHLVVLDSVPIIEALERCDARFASEWWHWFFFAQAEKPERAILADPEAWYRSAAPAKDNEGYADFLQAILNPATVHGMLEDYRAGLSIDRRHDEEDRAAGRRVICPTLVLWSLRDDLEQIFGDVLGVWRPWTTACEGRGLDCGHHMAEEVPEELADELIGFLSKV